MCVKCVSEKMARKIEQIQDQYDDLPDGAYLAVCDENGVQPEDLMAYFDEHEKEKPCLPPNKKKS